MTQEEQNTEKQVGNFPFAPLFPDSYWEKQREREGERFEKNEKFEKRRAKMGAFADLLRSVGDTINTAKGNRVYQNPYAGKVTESAMNSLNRLEADHARALQGIDRSEQQAKMFDANRQQRADEAQKSREFRAGESQKGREYSTEEAEKGRDFRANEAEKSREFQAGQNKENRQYNDPTRLYELKTDHENLRAKNAKEQAELEAELRMKTLEREFALKNGAKIENNPEYIALAGDKIRRNQELKNIMMNKPEDMSDEEHQKAIAKYIQSKGDPTLQALVEQLGKNQVLNAKVMRYLTDLSEIPEQQQQQQETAPAPKGESNKVSPLASVLSGSRKDAETLQKQIGGYDKITDPAQKAQMLAIELRDFMSMPDQWKDTRAQKQPARDAIMRYLQSMDAMPTLGQEAATLLKKEMGDKAMKATRDQRRQAIEKVIDNHLDVIAKDPESINTFISSYQ